VTKMDLTRTGGEGPSEKLGQLEGDEAGSTRVKEKKGYLPRAHFVASFEKIKSEGGFIWGFRVCSPLSIGWGFAKKYRKKGAKPKTAQRNQGSKGKWEGGGR